jgi:single-stranded-DNA-specific exonuclease
VALEESTGTQLSGIAFGFGHLAEDLKSGHPFSIAYHVEENIWNGNVSLQLMVKDVKLSESVEF